MRAGIGGEQGGLVGCTPGVFHVFSIDLWTPGPQSVPLEMASLARGDALKGSGRSVNDTSLNAPRPTDLPFYSLIQETRRADLP